MILKEYGQRRWDGDIAYAVRAARYFGSDSVVRVPTPLRCQAEYVLREWFP
jgi:hypothetical protein